MPQKSFHVHKILIPIDFSETAMLAIEHASFMAQLFKADLVLLHIIEKHWEKYNIIAPDNSVQEPGDMVNTIEKRLEGIGEDIKEKYGVNTLSITTNGNIFKEIISISKEYNVDMIVMGSHGASGFVESFLGSNTYKVASISEIPVLSVQKHAKKLGFTNIVLPIDNSPHSRQKVHHAIVLANHFGASIHILGLINTDDETMKHQIETKVNQVEDFIAKAKIGHTKKMVNGYNLSKMTHTYAKEIDADLIIIMGDQEESFMGKIMGGYSQQIIHHSKIPTLCIAPEIGYLSTDSMTNPY